jgi:hypothetical protein
MTSEGAGLGTTTAPSPGTTTFPGVTTPAPALPSPGTTTAPSPGTTTPAPSPATTSPGVPSPATTSPGVPSPATPATAPASAPAPSSPGAGATPPGAGLPSAPAARPASSLAPLPGPSGGHGPEGGAPDLGGDVGAAPLSPARGATTGTGAELAASATDVERRRDLSPFASARPVSTLQLGGGVATFSRSALRNVADAGPYWDVRAAFGANRIFGVEAAYLGAAHSIPGAFLVRNGLEGTVRLNAPVVRGPVVAVPFALAGLGWSRFQIADGDGDGDALQLSGENDVAVLPVGAGIAIGYDRALLDLRFAYRFTFQDAILDNGRSREDGQLESYTVGAQLGFVF